MKIGIDTRALETGHRYRGIGAYAENLIKNISHLDEQNDYVFLTQKNPSAASQIIKNPKFHHHDQLVFKTADSTRYYWYKDQYYFPRAVKKSGADIVHYLDQLSAPLIKATKTIVTVHDLIQLLDQPDLKTKIKFYPVKYADMIIAPSEFTRKLLINDFKINPDKIRIVFHGYDQDKYQVENNARKIADFRQKLLKGNFEKYFLYVGAVGEARKNLEFIIEAFAQVIKDNPAQKVALVLVGKSGPGAENIINKIAGLGLKNNVIMTDFVQDLLIYFQTAEAFLFPSLYEGFGLPPLEAMACGTPVISSNATSLPEVVGHAGVLLSPKDHKGWIQAMSQILHENNYRQKLISAGLKQVQKFSWEKTAEGTLKVYEELACKQ